MKPRPARLGLILGFVIGTLTGPILQAAAHVDEARVRQIAAMLEKEPRGVGHPITDRAAWQQAARLPGAAEILRSAEAELKHPLPTISEALYLDFSRTGNRERFQKVYFQRRRRLVTLALGECIENRGRFLKALDEVLVSTCNEPLWHLMAHDTRLDNYYGRTVDIDLGAAMTAWDLATVKWLLADKLPESTRQLIAKELRRRIFTPYRDAAEGKRKLLHWMTVTSNWNAVCNAGVVGAALEELPSPEDRAFFIATAEHFLRYFLKGFAADGYCFEGLGYWNYGFGHYIMLTEAVRQATEGRLDLLADPLAKNPALFPFRCRIAPGIYPSIADCDPGEQPDPALLAYVTRRFGLGRTEPAPELERAPGRAYPLVLMDLFRSDWAPPGKPQETVRGGLRTWFSDGGVLICRPDPSGVPFAACLKGGTNGEHHNHNDVGSFSVVSGRTMIICDPGAEVYTGRTFSSRRYESDVLSSFGHAVPVVNGSLQRSGSRARARILRSDFTDTTDTLSMDIRSAYPVKGLEKLQRTFTYQRGPSPSLTVRDELRMANPGTFETALISWGKWEMNGDNEIRIVDGTDSVRVKVDTGGRAFSVKAKQLLADVGGRRKAQHIGIALAEPVTDATITLTIMPGKN